MFTSKAPSITAEIERRIRRGYYTGHLPDNARLQREFKVARQTMTEALRPLVARGILHCRTPRNGLEIHPENVLRGNILIISPSNNIEQLDREMLQDGFTPKLCRPCTLAQFREHLKKPLSGVLFFASTMNVDMAHLLIERGIPFVSCNKLPIISSEVNTIDYDLDADLNWFLSCLMQNGYRRVGIFPYGRMEGYNEYLLKAFRRIKRNLGLPLEAYDRITFPWDMPLRERLKRLLDSMHKGNCFPQAIFSLYDLRQDMVALAQSLGYPLPKNMLVACLVSRNNQSISTPSNFLIANSIYSQWRLWTDGYSLLRELMLGLHARPQQRTVTRLYKFLGEIPPAGTDFGMGR